MECRDMWLALCFVFLSDCVEILFHWPAILTGLCGFSQSGLVIVGMSFIPHCYSPLLP